MTTNFITLRHQASISNLLRFLVFCCLLISFFNVNAQVQEMLENNEVVPCATDYVHEQLMNTDPAYRIQYEKLQEQIYKIAKNKLENGTKDGTLKSSSLAACASGSNVLTIPIVIYIVHATADATPTDGTSNPTDAQIFQGIQDLNDAFQNVGAYAGHGHGANDGSNPDAALLESVDVEIQFCLAQRDINGNATTGIYRTPNDTYSDLDIDSEIGAMKAFVESQVGSGLFPDSDYAGVWLFDRLCSVSSGLGCGIGGFAGPSLGVLNLASIFGSSTSGSTVHVHEFGHYLSLAHTWEGGCTNGDCLLDGDSVCDTPPDDSTTGVACGTAANTCNTDTDSGPFTVDQDDLYENYMDYSTNSCQNTFTQGQKDRMRASLLSRPSLLESKGCINPNMLEAGITNFVFPNELACGTDFSPIITIDNNGNVTLTTIVFSVVVDGGASTSVTSSVSIAMNASAEVTLDPVSIVGTGSHNIEVTITSINGNPADSYVRNNNLCNSFIYNPPISTLPYCEDVEDSNINNDFLVLNPTEDGTFDVGTTTGCAGNNGNNAIRYYSRNGGVGQEDALIVKLDLGNYESANLTFDVAYKRSYSNRTTTLDVAVSNDCEINYTSLYNKTQNDLNTASPNDFDPELDWVPDGCDDWRTETINLDNYAGCDNTIIKFLVTLGGIWGQNLYLDNICINGTPCTALTNTTNSPNTITSCGSATDIDLTVGNKATVISDPTKEVVGWWITKDAAISNTVTDKPSTQTALAGATVGGALGTNANVIYEGDGSTGSHTLSVDCNNLASGTTYYATPFVSQKEAAIPTENCVVDVNTSSNITFNGFPGKFNRVAPGDICRPANPPNSPTFTYCVTVSGYTGPVGNLAMVIRDDNTNGNNLVVDFSVGTGDGNATYCYTEADIPGYDPGDPTLTSGMTVVFWEEGGNGMQNGTLSTSLDITYPGATAVNFPTSRYSDCLFGPAITFTCDCANCPTATTVNNDSGTVCTGGGTDDFTTWQGAITTANPLDAGQDPDDLGSIVYSSVTPVAGSQTPDNNIPTGTHSGVDNCVSETQSVSAYLYCDTDGNGTINTGDTYTLISTYALTVYPAVQAPTITTNGCVLTVKGACADVVTLSGQTVSNGAITNNGTNSVTYTAQSADAAGMVTINITSGISGNTCTYTASTTTTPSCPANCPTAATVNNDSGTVCTDGGTDDFGTWQGAITTANPLDAGQDPGGLGSIVYSSVTPVVGGQTPDNNLPTGTHSGANNCVSETQSVSAYLYCDTDDNGAINTGDTYTLISTYALTVYPAVQAPTITTNGCVLTVKGACADVVTLSGQTVSNGTITNNGTNSVTYTAQANDPAGTVDIDIVSGINGNTCTYTTSMTATPQTQCQVTFPIRLSQFSGQIDGKVNVIEWTTATEINSQMFVIERSEDGKEDWTKIGEVAAKGQSNTPSNYRLIDERPSVVTYYRLKSIDFDDQFEFSNIIMIERKVENTISVYPIPATDHIRLEYQGVKPTPSLLTITDIVGRIVYQKQLNTVEGLNTENLEVSEFSSGVYFITLDNQDEKLTIKIIKQ